MTASAEFQSDRLWDRICDADEEARVAEELGMTVAEYRKHCQTERDEAAIANREWNRDE